MAFTRIIHWLGLSFLFCAAISLLAILFGVILGELYVAQIFVFMAIILILVGGVLCVSTSNAIVRESTGDALIFLLLFWLLTPIVLALPFYMSGVTSTLSQAYFESVSAITTTGASTLTPEDIPRTFLIWRSLLQACGGIVVSTFAVVILAALNLSGTGVHRSKLFTLKRGELFPRLVAIGKIVTAIYAVIAFICFAGLLLTGAAPIDAICLSLSAISTGGLTPQSGGVSAYISRIGAALLALTCIFGAANIAVLWDFIRMRSAQQVIRFFTNVEHRGMFVMIAVLLLCGVFYAGIANLFVVSVEAAYMITTTGFDYEVIGIDVVPRALLISLALIGGSAISTAGGIKIIRFLLLMRHAATDLDRMSHPSRVKLVKFRGNILQDREFLSIWMYFFGYTLLFGGGIMALGAAGLDFSVAVSACAAALSNFGPLLQATFPDMSYSYMGELQLWVLSWIMLFGRVEVLAALAVFSPSLWKR